MRPVPFDLDDDAAVAVFADALASEGDPRGTLMHLHLAREERPFDARLAHAEARHLALHGKALLGSLQTASSMLTLHWRRGFLTSVSLRSLAGDVRWGEPTRPAPRSRFPRLLRELGALPVAQRLERLELSMPWSSFCLDHFGAALDEALVVRPRSLRTLRVEVVVAGEEGWDDDWMPRAEPLVANDGALRIEVDPALRPWLERAGVTNSVRVA
jgi:hypothetical protein